MLVGEMLPDGGVCGKLFPYVSVAEVGLSIVRMDGVATIILRDRARNE